MFDMGEVNDCIKKRARHRIYFENIFSLQNLTGVTLWIYISSYWSLPKMSWEPRTQGEQVRAQQAASDVHKVFIVC